MIQFLRIDGHDPHVEFQVAAGKYSYDNGEFRCDDDKNCRYTLEEMIKKWPTKGNKLAVAAINTDYFDQGGSNPVSDGHDHRGIAPAQGTTWINGKFKYEFYSQADNPDWDLATQNGDGQGDGICKRTSLNISEKSPYSFSLSWCERGFNVTGAGPHFLVDGVPTWNRNDRFVWNDNTARGINGEYFPTDNFDTVARQSAAGISQNGQFLILASSANTMSPEAMAKALSDHSLQGASAYNAIRLDGGGSVQMYYDDAYLIQSTRAVAAGLIVYSDPLPPPLREIRSAHSNK